MITFNYSIFFDVHPCDSTFIITRNIERLRKFSLSGRLRPVSHRFVHLKAARLYLIDSVRFLLPPDYRDSFTSFFATRLLADKCLCCAHISEFDEMGMTIDRSLYKGDTAHCYYDISDIQCEEIATRILSRSVDYGE